MTITAEILLEIIALLGTALAGVWYVATTVNKLQAQIDKLETRLEAVQDQLKTFLSHVGMDAFSFGKR